MKKTVSFSQQDGWKVVVDHSSPYILVLTGLPGSGKSTFRSMLVGDVVHLSTDDHIEAVAQEQGRFYDDVFEDVIKEATTKMNEKLRATLKAGKNIVLDQTNLGTKKRRGILSQVPSTYYKIAVVVECHEDIRQKRLADRPGKTIPDHIDRSMVMNKTLPSVEEGFDEIHTVHMDPPHTGRKKETLI